MTLKSRLVLFLFVQCVVTATIVLMSLGIADQVVARFRLGEEARAIRKLQRLVLEEAQLAAELLLLPQQTDLLRYHELITSAEEQLAELEALPASPSTMEVLPSWRSANREFKHQLEKTAFGRPAQSLAQASSVLQRLRDRCSSQLQLLKSASDRVRLAIDSDDEQIRSHMRTFIGRTALLLLVSLLFSALMVSSFANALGRHLARLDAALRALAEGRSGDVAPGAFDKSPPELLSVLGSLERLAGALRRRSESEQPPPAVEPPPESGLFLQRR